MYPAHLFIFGDMARAIGRLALSEPASALPTPRRAADAPAGLPGWPELRA
jgi:hypothetical protein